VEMAMPPPARCTLPEAICVVANEPLEGPADPFSLDPRGDDYHGDARHFLANLFAMRILAAANGEAIPPVPTEWRDLRQRIGLCSGGPSAWTEEDTWRTRITSMHRFCADAGKTPAYWAKQWAKREPEALQYVADLARRNARLCRGAEVVRQAVMDDGGPRLFGTDCHTKAFGEVPEAVRYDSRARWRTDPAAILYENRVRFLNVLECPGRGYDELSFSRRAIRELAAEVSGGRPVSGAAAGSTQTPHRPSVEAAKIAAIAIFPEGPPTTLLAKIYYAKIQEEVERRGAKAKERSIRTAIAELRAEGMWPA